MKNKTTDVAGWTLTAAKLSPSSEFIATCKANGVNPHESLKDVLARINTHPFLKLAELLPHNWKAAREKK